MSEEDAGAEVASIIDPSIKHTSIRGGKLTSKKSPNRMPIMHEKIYPSTTWALYSALLVLSFFASIHVR
jgi:hypothetical protein